MATLSGLSHDWRGEYWHCGGAMTIEFITPREGAFGVSDVADFVGVDSDEAVEFGDEGPRSKWLTALAVVAVTGLLAGGVIAAAPWSESEGESAPTTTPAATAPTRSSQSTPTTEGTTRGGADPSRPIDPPGWVIDPAIAPSWQFLGGSSDPSRAQGGDDHLQLWTVPGSTRTSGAWLATFESSGGADRFQPDATRLDSVEGEIVVSTAADGVAELQFSGGNGRAINVRSYGIELADLLAFASAIQAQEGAISYPTAVQNLDSPAGRLEPLVSFRGWHSGPLVPQLDATATWSLYVNSERGRYLQIRSGPSDSDVQVALGFLLADAEPISFGQSDSIKVGDWGVVSVLRDSGIPVARIINGEETIHVTGFGFTNQDLVDLLPSLRRASTDEWSDQLNRTQTPDEPYPTRVGSSTSGPQSSDGARYDAMAFGSLISLNSDHAQGLIGVDATQPSSITSYSAPGITVVLALASESEPHAALRVAVDGQEPVDVPLVALGYGLGSAAAYAFTANQSYTSEWVD
jgi:hypothetical protein